MLNRLRFNILSVLSEGNSVGSASAMSAYELEEEMQLEYKADSIYKSLVTLKKFGYVDTGLKDGKANTYYITEKGKKVLEDARKAG